MAADASSRGLPSIMVSRVLVLPDVRGVLPVPEAVGAVLVRLAG